jgi:hypothetical protein
MRSKTVSTAVVIGILLLLGSLARAEDTAPAAATLTLKEESVGVGVGLTRGHGVLTYQGREYPFSAKGLSVGEVGVVRAEARGTVYHLENLADFNGSYTSAEAEATIAGGAGVTIMRNQNGVLIRLVSTTQGADLKLAAEGVTLRLAK